MQFGMEYAVLIHQILDLRKGLVKLVVHRRTRLCSNSPSDSRASAICQSVMSALDMPESATSQRLKSGGCGPACVAARMLTGHALSVNITNQTRTVPIGHTDLPERIAVRASPAY